MAHTKELARKIARERCEKRKLNWLRLEREDEEKEEKEVDRSEV